MDFKSRYLPTLREKDPDLFRALIRTGQIDSHLQSKSEEAHQLVSQMLAREPRGENGLPKDPQALRLAEERAMEQMLEMPQPLADQNPEPPYDLPTRMSQVRTSASSPVS